MGMFKWKRYDEWIANVQWLDNRWMEYVPMNMLVGRRSLLGPSPRNKIADGMNAAGRSAKRLFDDAQLLADAARFSVMPF